MKVEEKRRLIGVGGTALALWLILGLAAGRAGCALPSDSSLDEGDGPTGEEEAARALVDTLTPDRIGALAKALRREGALDDLELLARRLEDPRLPARALKELGLARSEAPDLPPETYRAAFARALDLTDSATHAAEAARNAYAWLYAEYYREQLPEAFERLLEADRLAEASGDRDAIRKADLAVPTLLADFGDFRRAETRARRARDRARAEGRALDEARAANLLGTIAKEQGRLQAARRWYHQALSLADQASRDEETDRECERSFLINLITTELELGRLERARPLVARLERDHPRPETGPGRSMRVLIDARLALLEGRPGAALAATRQVPRNERRASAVDFAVVEGDAHRALGHRKAASEAYGRAVEAVEERAEVSTLAVRSAVRESWRRPFEQLFLLAENRAERAEAFERLKGQTFRSALAGAPTVAAPLTAEAIRARLRAPRLAAAAPTGPEPSWPAIREALEGRQALGWLAAGGRLHLVALTDRLRVDELVSAAEVERLAGHFEADVDDEGLARELGAALLPDDLDLDPDRVIHLITDRALSRVPLALVHHRGGPLYERFTLAHVPSFGALAALSSNRTSTPGPERAAVLAAGDLREATREARAVAARLGVQPVLGARSTDLARARDAGLLHLAAHGSLDAEGGTLWLEDGAVRPVDVLAQRIAPRRVVLASCAAAAREGSGLWGSMAAGFLAAGSTAVIAPLWSVDDAAARRFVERFYAAGGAEDPFRALALTQRALAATGRPRAGWAPFVAIGTPELRTPPE